MSTFGGGLAVSSNHDLTSTGNGAHSATYTVPAGSFCILCVFDAGTGTSPFLRVNGQTIATATTVLGANSGTFSIVIVPTGSNFSVGTGGFALGTTQSVTYLELTNQ